MIGETVCAGSLKRILEAPRRHFVATANKDTAKGCQKSFFSLDSGALAKKFQCDTPQDLAATLEKLYLTASPETLMTRGELREIIARLRRLHDILGCFDLRGPEEQTGDFQINFKSIITIC